MEQEDDRSNPYNEYVQAGKSELIEKTITHIGPNGKTFSEPIFLFAEKSEEGGTPPYIQYHGQDFWLNKFAYERKQARKYYIGTTSYEIPRYGEDGELEGVYFIVLPDRSREPKEEETTAQTSGSSWHAKNRRSGSVGHTNTRASVSA